MSKIALIAFAVLFIFSLYVKSAVSVSNEIEEKRGDKESKYSPLWFGPRIGRKKRNLADELFQNYDNEEAEVLLEFIKKNPWTIILFSNGKGRMLGYNPKYNKESADEMNEEVIGDLVQRSMFAPRLGRS